MLKRFLKKFSNYVYNKPYLVFFTTIYICLICKFYVEYKINLIYKEEKLLKIYKEKLVYLQNEYETEIYKYLKYNS